MINLFGKELNLEETFVGSCIQFPFYFVVGWWVLPLMLVSGVLWSLGGAKNSNKLFRRLGVPVATTLTVFACNPTWWSVFVFMFAGWGVISMGYGIPDKTDEGSILGRFYLWATNDRRLADFATRLTTYLIYWLIFIPVIRISI